jgi:uncharacterized SAM-binding protein YcdF (DUF218 family)
MKKRFLVLGFISFLYAFIMLIQTSNMDTGLAVFFLIGGFFTLLFFKNGTAKGIYIRHKKAVWAIMAALFLFIGTLEVLILKSANTDPSKVSGKTDIVLVLGGGTKKNKPGAVLKGRLDQALGYAQDQPAITFVVSGGLGFGKTVSEAAIMKNYLIEHGIRGDRIVIEEKATSTFENLLYTKELIHPSDRVLIVTSDFHLFRTKMIAKRVGIEAEGLGTPIRLSSVPQAHVREYFAIIKSFFVDR